MPFLATRYAPFSGTRSVRTIRAVRSHDWWRLLRRECPSCPTKGNEPVSWIDWSPRRAEPSHVAAVQSDQASPSRSGTRMHGCRYRGGAHAHLRSVRERDQQHHRRLGEGRRILGKTLERWRRRSPADQCRHWSRLQRHQHPDPMARGAVQGISISRLDDLQAGAGTWAHGASRRKRNARLLHQKDHRVCRWSARWINQACFHVEADVKGGKILIHALRDIFEGEELSIDYGQEYFDEFIKPYACKCGAGTHRS
jgi:hypothetical protein